MPIPRPFRRFAQPKLPPVDLHLIPDDELAAGDIQPNPFASAAPDAQTPTNYSNPMLSPFAQDVVQRRRNVRWEEDGDASVTGHDGACVRAVSCLPPLLHRRGSSASASASRSRSGGSGLGLQSISSRRLAAAAAAMPDPPDESPPGGYCTASSHEDVDQASDWLFGEGSRPHFAACDPAAASGPPSSDSCGVYAPLPGSPSGRLGGSGKGSRRVMALCCCAAPTAEPQ